MKKLFTAIRASDFEMVRQIIEKKPELVNCVAKKPPKKDDGQSFGCPILLKRLILNGRLRRLTRRKRQTSQRSNS